MERYRLIRIHLIESFDDPSLEPYRTMRRQLDHRQKQIFVAEGEKIVRRLLESDFIVVSVLLPQRWFQAFEPLLNVRAEEIQVYVADKELLETLTGFSMYQGVLAVGKIPKLASVETVLQESARPYLFAAVDGITSADNLGVLVRNCVAFGAQALFVGETSSSPYLRRAVRSSMGAIFRLPVVEVTGLAGTLSGLSHKMIRCIAAHPHTRQTLLPQADLAGDCCLVFGSEGAGLSRQILELCDEAVAIPMQAGVDSLNVGNAGAVFLYEANRQRGKYQ